MAAIAIWPRETHERPIRCAAFCWADGRRKADSRPSPRKGSPIVEGRCCGIRGPLQEFEDLPSVGSDPDHVWAVRQDCRARCVVKTLYLVWPPQAAPRVAANPTFGEAMAYMLRRQDGLPALPRGRCVDIDSNRVENAIPQPGHETPQTVSPGHDEGGRNWARLPA